MPKELTQDQILLKLKRIDSNIVKAEQQIEIFKREIEICKMQIQLENKQHAKYHQFLKNK